MKVSAKFLASVAALALAAPAYAATNIAFSFATVEADFVQPKAAGVVSRQYVGTGNILFKTTLANGTYGFADVAAFDLDLRILARIMTSALIDISADFHFGLADLTALSITYSGGVPISASFSTGPKSYYQSTNSFNPFPASVDFASGGNSPLAINAFPPGGVKTTYARTDIDARLNETAVPEPTTWAMMIAGFALVGAALRRRSIRVAFAI